MLNTAAGRGNLRTHSARRLQELAIAVLGQPKGSREMRVMDAPCPLGLGQRVDAENDASRLLPSGALGSSVEQAQVGPQMRAIVIGQLRIARRGIDDSWLDRMRGVVHKLCDQVNKR